MMIKIQFIDEIDKYLMSKRIPDGLSKFNCTCKDDIGIHNVIFEANKLGDNIDLIGIRDNKLNNAMYLNIRICMIPTLVPTYAGIVTKFTYSYISYIYDYNKDSINIKMHDIDGGILLDVNNPETNMILYAIDFLNSFCPIFTGNSYFVMKVKD